MPELGSVRFNYSYIKENGKYKRLYEVIILTVKPTYTLNNSIEIIKSREIVECRFTASEETLDSLILSLNEIKSKKDEE